MCDCISAYLYSYLQMCLFYFQKCVFMFLCLFLFLCLSLPLRTFFYHDPLLLPVLFSSLFRKDIDRQGRPTKSAAGMVNTTKSQKQRYKQLKETKNRID